MKKTIDFFLLSKISISLNYGRTNNNNNFNINNLCLTEMAGFFFILRLQCSALVYPFFLHFFSTKVIQFRLLLITLAKKKKKKEWFPSGNKKNFHFTFFFNHILSLIFFFYTIYIFLWKWNHFSLHPIYNWKS